MDVTLFLASRNLAFRGDTDELGDINNRNFLGLLELVSHYDPILRNHLRTVPEFKEKGKVMPAHYLSGQIQNEFIEFRGQHVFNNILEERIRSIYFSVICDATPDISHTEQNVLLIRYLHKNDDDWKIHERFVEFVDFTKKTGKEIAEMIGSALHKHNIDISDCRGQGYDNGANMSGKTKGVQAEILKRNPLATYSLCVSHSLNLVGVHAAESSNEVKTFFGCINRLYTLFSSSPERWS